MVVNQEGLVASGKKERLPGIGRTHERVKQRALPNAQYLMLCLNVTTKSYTCLKLWPPQATYPIILAAIVTRHTKIMSLLT
jgi:hypothetical protein